MKILVVDNDAVLRELVRDVIVDHLVGVKVAMGIDGQDGWREFQESQPDLVITDLKMETNDAGFVLARKIKAASPTTPVIMISGGNDKALQLPEAVVDYVVRKPFDGDGLVEKIKELLARR